MQLHVIEWKDMKEGRETSVWSVDVNLENGYSMTTSFGVSRDVLDIMKSDSHSQCTDISFDENKQRYERVLPTKSAKSLHLQHYRQGTKSQCEPIIM